MKYARLSKEQLEELHPEFIRFLATQTITALEWETIKKEKPAVAEQEIDIFSDLIWQGVLQKVRYLEHASASQLYLFSIEQDQMHVIVLKVADSSIDLQTQNGVHWVLSHIKEDSVSLYTASKDYTRDKLLDIFKLIEKGAQITQGVLYQKIKPLI